MSVAVAVDKGASLGIKRAQLEGDFKGGCGFLAKDIEDLEGGERFRLTRPEQFGALTATKLLLAKGGGAQHGDARGGRDFRLANQPVPFADEQIADVKRDGDAVFGVECGFAIAGSVIVLDIIVHEGRFVKTFNRDSDAPQIGWERSAGFGAEC